MTANLHTLQISDGAVHQYRLDETSGTTATDRGSSVSNGTYVTGVTLNQTAVSADVAGSASFNGTSGYASLGFNDPPAGGSGQFSFELVFNSISQKTNPEILSNDNPFSTGNGIQLEYNSGTMGLIIGFTGGKTTVAGPAITSGIDYHVIVTWDGVSSLKIYINGALFNSGTTSGTYKPASFLMDIGRNPQTAANFANILIGDVAFYNTVLTPTQALAHFGATLKTGQMWLDVPSVSGGDISIPPSLTTLLTDEVIVAIVGNYSSSYKTVTSISGGGLTWTLRKRFQWNNGTVFNDLEVWSAPAYSIVSGATITPTMSGSPSAGVIDVFGVCGCSNMAAPWDTNGSLPGTANATSVTGLSTNSSMPFVIAVAGVEAVGNFNGGNTTPSGFTNFFSTRDSIDWGQQGIYDSLSSAMSSTTVGPWTGGIAAATDSGMLVDALTSSAPPTPARGGTMFVCA